MATLLRLLTIRKYLHLGCRSTVQYLTFALRQMTEWKPTWRHANEMIMGKKNLSCFRSALRALGSLWVSFQRYGKYIYNLLRALPWKGAPWARCRYATYSQVTKHQHSLQSAGLREMTEGEQVDCNTGNYLWWTERGLLTVNIDMHEYKVLWTEEFSETKTSSSV